MRLVPVARDAGPGEQASREQGGTTHPPSASEHEHTMKIINKLLTRTKKAFPNGNRDVCKCKMSTTYVKKAVGRTSGAMLSVYFVGN